MMHDDQKSGLASFSFADTAFRLADETFSAARLPRASCSHYEAGAILIGAISFSDIVQVRLLVLTSASLCKWREESKVWCNKVFKES